MNRLDSIREAARRAREDAELVAELAIAEPALTGACPHQRNVGIPCSRCSGHEVTRIPPATGRRVEIPEWGPRAARDARRLTLRPVAPRPAVPEPTRPPDHLSTREVARAADVRPMSVRNAIARGQLIAVRGDGPLAAFWIPRAAAEAWLASRSAPKPAPAAKARHAPKAPTLPKPAPRPADHLSAREVAGLGPSRKTVARAVAAGDLPSTRTGGRLWILESDARAWIARIAAAATGITIAALAIRAGCSLATASAAVRAGQIEVEWDGPRRRWICQPASAESWIAGRSKAAA